MDESERMTALKRVYADMMLDTAKEAAGRVMVAERRVRVVEYELKETNEEAVRVLVRTKRMIDSNMREAEIRSQIQQRKIEELEAQLQEAEDIVGDLRLELGEAQCELERLAKYQRRPMEEIVPVDDVVHSQECEMQENDVNECGFTCSPKEDKDEVATTNVSALNAITDANDHLDVLSGDNFYVRTTEPELYKNGCTQRIRACDGNSLNGHRPLDEEIDDGKSRQVVEDDKNHLTPFPSKGNGRSMDENLDEAKVAGNDIMNGLEAIGQVGQAEANNSKTMIVPAKEMLEGADLAGTISSETSPADSAVRPFETFHVEDLSNGHTVSDSRMQDDSHAMLPVTLHRAGKNSVVAKDMKLENFLVLNSYVSVTENGSGISICRAGLFEQNGELAGLKAPVSDSTNSVAEEDADDRLIKYIFQRKRKKLPVSLDHDDATNGEGRSTLPLLKQKNQIC